MKIIFCSIILRYLFKTILIFLYSIALCCICLFQLRLGASWVFALEPVCSLCLSSWNLLWMLWLQCVIAALIKSQKSRKKSSLEKKMCIVHLIALKIMWLINGYVWSDKEKVVAIATWAGLRRTLWKKVKPKNAKTIFSIDLH